MEVEPLLQQKKNITGPTLNFWLLNGQFENISEATSTTPHLL